MIERQVFATWYTPDEKLPPDEDKKTEIMLEVITESEVAE